ncbi:acylamino-acid-releasing enzyme 2 isoform X2 [Lolium perenne]|uniref:acylamino-acid-releasing enzyme 2 isoform X2 n=1 Tax=Lolium perenne TaxID=4522 RepID=UPI003A997922
MQVSEPALKKHDSSGMDAMMSEEYAWQSKLLEDFTCVPSIESAWVFKTSNGDRSTAMFSISQADLLANNTRKHILYSHISRHGTDPLECQWSPFPIEMTGVSVVVPSPSGSKLLVVRNGEKGSCTKLQIVDQSHVDKEIHVDQSTHGPLFIDEWFQGISWNQEETFIAYIAEESPRPTPAFDDAGYRKEGSSEKGCNSWRGLGEWEENWGETYSIKGRPSLFVLDIASGEVRTVRGIAKSLSIGQVVWAPPSSTGHQKHLVFVGWLEHNGFQKTARKLGIKYCSNRPCSLYAIRCPFEEPNADNASLSGGKSDSASVVTNLTPSISSAFFPRFSKDGKLLVFLSAKCAVDSGAHNATDSLHKINWPSDWKTDEHLDMIDVVPPVMCPDDGCFPGLYCSSMLSDPWLSNHCTIILTSAWRSTQVILLVDVLSGKVTRISPELSDYSWSALAVNGSDVLSVSSSPIDPPQISYGHEASKEDHQTRGWVWEEVTSPLMAGSNKVKALLSHHKFSILKIPVTNPCDELSDGGQLPFEAIFVSCEDSSQKPTVLILHGGPHSTSVSSYSKSSAFLASLGFNLLVVNYRGTLGFGEEALQSLPGKVGSQDVQDCLMALDYVIKEGLIDASKVAVVGISHGGFLSTHLIGQVKAPLLMLLGGADLRVPVSNGLQYARALRERGGDIKTMMFPEDIHEINIPRSDFESFLNIGIWFKKYLK